MTACLEDWELRFWQSSTDHRGTPEFPGRVATVVPSPGARVWGRAYLLPGRREHIMEYLDHREKNGYRRLPFQVTAHSGSRLQVLCYVGCSEGGSFVGPEDEHDTAAIITKAVGPSGKNIDYLRNLHQSLHQMERMEPHVERLLRLVDSYPQSTP